MGHIRKEIQTTHTDLSQNLNHTIHDGKEDVRMKNSPSRDSPAKTKRFRRLNYDRKRKRSELQEANIKRLQ